MVKDVLFEPVRKTQDAMFFYKNSNDMWVPCGPKQPGAVEITMQELAAEGLASKSNSFVEGVSHKIRRQIKELERVSGVESNALTVDGVPVDSYLTRFVWDEAKYPTMSPLRETVDSIHSQVSKIEDDLKVRVAEYNNVRSQLNAINQKQSGSLAVWDLSNVVKPEDIITSEHLVTLLAVVPKYSQKDWLASYETLTSYVVPRSSKKLFEDNEYALYTVTLFGRVADNFRTASREKGFQIRDFEHSPEAQESRKQELEKLIEDQGSMRSSLLQWCYNSYGEHLDALLCCARFHREHFEIWSAAIFLGMRFSSVGKK
ncbi:V-type proton ATPase subunit C-like isoform X2 [Quercus robur]|uniref:V-type proton ATPase subunit C-like isoform X2 n=1 Tax=Quercus robur TaxID=38942 RepID=UPI002162823B|nr:V-type proton ATPase subunit C-like isoform X2 [Quercus robur]